MNCLRPVLFAAFSAASAFAPAKAPNFLFIAIDHRKPILGHLGEEPNNFLSENRIADPALMSVRSALNNQLDQRIQAGPFPCDLGKAGGSSAEDEDAPARPRPVNRKNKKS